MAVSERFEQRVQVRLDTSADAKRSAMSAAMSAPFHSLYLTSLETGGRVGLDGGQCGLAVQFAARLADQAEASAEQVAEGPWVVLWR